MHLSKFGQKFTANSGILQLMDDLGHALAQGEGILMLGGGNPAHIPAVQAQFREGMIRMMENGTEFERVVGNYDPPQGKQRFLEALAALLRRQYGWEIGARNIALTHGSQSAFFFLFNMFAGAFHDGSHKKILLPLAPEYIGYVDVGLEADLFTASRPEIEYLDEHTFKYHVNFEAVSITDEIGAICVSRPTNPTGNVLTEAEINKLSELAQTHDIPLIIDNAYGTPFPNIIFTEVAPIWNEQTILCMSLSKLGLPATRTGIVIANESVIKAISGINAISSLAPSSFGAALALELIESDEIIRLSREVIKPYYQQKAEQAVAQLWQELDGLDFYIHKAEGALFLWLWFRDLPITSQELYQRLKHRGVLVVPGHYFFPGLPQAWPHKQECIRVTYSQAEAVVRAGLRIIGEEVKRAYDG
jgi:valine--pyruvate aminotransferase